MKSCYLGADKNLENDEPLFSSSSDEEQDGDQVTQRGPAPSPPLNPRKRRAGHTPLDLAKCLKVQAAGGGLVQRCSGGALTCLLSSGEEVADL